MKSIKTYSKKKFSLRFSIWELNIISFVKSCNIPDDEFFPFDILQFNYEFNEKHGLLGVAEDIEAYSYS